MSSACEGGGGDECFLANIKPIISIAGAVAFVNIIVMVVMSTFYSIKVNEFTTSEESNENVESYTEYLQDLSKREELALLKRYCARKKRLGTMEGMTMEDLGKEAKHSRSREKIEGEKEKTHTTLKNRLRRSLSGDNIKKYKDLIKNFPKKSREPIEQPTQREERSAKPDKTVRATKADKGKAEKPEKGGKAENAEADADKDDQSARQYSEASRLPRPKFGENKALLDEMEEILDGSAVYQEDPP